MTTHEFLYKDIWTKTLNTARDVLDSTRQISYDVFDQFFTDSKIVSIEDKLVTVVVPHFINCSLMNERSACLENCLEEVTNTRLKIKIITQADYDERNKKITFVNDEFPPEFKFKDLEDKYTFANYVVGRSNAQAHVAALTVSSNLGLIYNPLFIYGNPGLGKTHLLNAIGNQVRSMRPNAKIGFISGLDFVENVVKASKEGRLDEYKNFFNNLDLLLVDDIQYIAGKEKTHEVFFSVFNDLVNNRKHVCLTADKSPSDIKGLEERIISRFNQGLTVNIETPEYETCMNILKQKISNDTRIKQDIDEDVLSYLASNFSQDVRSLEGALTRLIFYSIVFSNEDRITLKTATEAFKDQIKGTSNTISISTVRKAVCDYYNLTKQQIISANRTKNIATPRHIAMYLCRKLLDAPYKDIGYEFGKRDHSTVISACESIEKKIKTEPAYLKVINEIESKIK